MCGAYGDASHVDCIYIVQELKLFVIPKPDSQF